MKDLLLSNKIFIRLLRHFLLFASMVILFAWVAYARSENSDSFVYLLLMVSANAFFFFGYAYLSAYLLIPFILFNKRYLLFIIIFILSGIIMSWLKFTLSDFLFYDAISPEHSQGGNGYTFSDILVNTKDMTFIVAVFSLLKFSRDNYSFQSRTSESEEKRLEAEIKVLEHQLDPHVIFNNFNNLYSISINRPDLLISTVKKLKAVLEYLFFEERETEVFLKKELSMIENYIGLERLRFGDRLKVNYKTEGNFEGVRIAPLVLYAFIENCFEHGAGLETGAAWINISIEFSEPKLKFVAANSLPDYFQADDNEYHGSLENSIRRLEMLYPNNHRLKVREKQNEHVVEFQIALK